LYTLVQLHSDVTSVNSVFVSDKIINSSANLDLSVKQVKFYVFFIFCFTFFYLILENMSTIVRKFPFSLLYLTLVTSCKVGLFLCCLLLYLIIYLYIYGYMNLPVAEMAFLSFDKTIIANFPTLIIKILF